VNGWARTSAHSPGVLTPDTKKSLQQAKSSWSDFSLWPTWSARDRLYLIRLMIKEAKRCRDGGAAKKCKQYLLALRTDVISKVELLAP